MVILQLEEQPPLIQAVFAGEIEQARNLLEHKEDVNYQDYEKRSALHAAAFRGDAGMAKLLIDHGARVNTKDSKWLTPLHRACSSGSEETVSVLLSHSADTSARDRQWQTPLHIAAAHNALECVSSLLDKVPNPNVTDRSGRTALHHAVLNGHNDIVQLLISKGCVVNACDKKDCRPMHWAAHMGHIDTIELLLRNGADINARDRNLYTPLHVAAASGMVSACRILLSYGADVDSQNAYGNTPLHIACLNGHVPVCQELVSNGCDKEALNYRGQTPLHIAAASTHGVHCLNYLVSMRVNINKQSLDGRTPLHMTAIHGRFTRSKTLIDRGAIVDCVDKNGCTALHIAAQHGHELLSNTLLSYGADASKKGHEGRTALHMCCLSGYVECCRTFIKAGVDINAQDDSGKTPTHCASYKGSVECLDLLVSSGADFKASDNIGRTALHYAAVQGYFDCVFTLVGIGSSVNQADNEGCTALHLAAAYDLEGRCVDYLIQHKADPRLKDKNGFTPVHYAVAGNNLCGLRYLLDSCGSAYLLFGHDMPSTTPLHLAAKNGNMEILEKLMPYFPDPNIKTEHGCTPLLLAARESFANCVQLLLRFGAKVSICDSVYNMSPVHHSAKNGHVHCLALLVDNTEDKSVIDLPDKLQRTALMLAVSNSHSDCVLTLIKSGADPNVVDSDFHSCLFRSVVTGQHNILQMLLPRSSTINKPDVNGKTVLHIAAACGRVTCLQRILHYMDCNVAASQDNQSFTSLHWACYSGSSECVEHLLKEGIFKKLEGNPFSAVHCATAAGSEKCLTLLCTYFGTDIVKLRDERSRTPLHIAALHGRMECALYLLQQGAEIECQDEDGRTPLIAAAQNGQVQVIEVLISYKADMTSFDKNGNTALHLACLQKHNHAALLLLEYTDDPSIINMANNDRKTPLHLSARNGLVDVTRQLILKGSSVIAVDSNGLTPALCCAPNPSVAQCLAIILASYPGLTTNNKKALLMNPKLFKTDEKTSTNSQTEISLVKNPDQFELEQMFEVKFQPDSDLKYSKEELLCLTSSIVQNFFEGKHSKKQRRKIISDTSCFIVENYDGNDDSFAEKPAASFGRDLHKSQSDMTLTTKTIYSEEDYGRIIQSARPKEECKGRKIVLVCPQSESKRLGCDPDRRKSLRRFQEPKGEFIMKKFLESTSMNQPEDARRPPRQPHRLRRKAESRDEQNQTRPHNYMLDLNRVSASAIYPEPCPFQVPCDEVSMETNKRREQFKVKNKCRGGAKPKQKTFEAKDGAARLRPKKSSKVEETLTTISSYCDHILKTVKADYTTYIPSHLRNKTTECNDLKSDLSVTTFIEGSKIEKCGENPLLSDDSLKKTRHVDAELTTTPTKNISKKQLKKKPDLKTLSFIHINPIYINEDKPRCYPTFWCFPEINKQSQDCRDLRSSSNQGASSDSSSSNEIQEGEGNSPNSDRSQEGDGNSPKMFDRTGATAPNASSSNQELLDSPNSESTVANSYYIQSQGGAVCYSPSSRADGVSLIFKGARDSPNLNSTFQAGVNLKQRIHDFPFFELKKKLEANARFFPNASAFNVDGKSRDSPNAGSSNSVKSQGRGSYFPSFEVGANSEANTRVFPTFKNYSPSFEIGANSDNLQAGFKMNVGVSPVFRYPRDSPNARSTFETAVNSKYKFCDSSSFELGGNAKKFVGVSPNRGALKIGNSHSNETHDTPNARSSVNSSSKVCDSPGGNSKKYETSSKDDDENSRSIGARDSSASNSRIFDSTSLESGFFEHRGSLNKSKPLRARARHGFEASAAGVSPDVNTLKVNGYDSPNTRSAVVSEVQGARDSPDSRNTFEISVNLKSKICNSPSKSDGKRAGHSSETSSDRSVLNIDGNACDSPNVKVYDSLSFELERNSKKSKAEVSPEFKVDGDLVKSNRLLCDSPNARSTVQSQRDAGYSSSCEVSAIVNCQEANIYDFPNERNTIVDLNSAQSGYSPSFEVGENSNANANCLAANICDSLNARSTTVDSSSVQSQGGAGYSPSFEVDENSSSNANCLETSTCNSPSFKIEQKKEGEHSEQSRVAVKHLNYDKRLKLEINKRLRRQAEEEYEKRNSSSKLQDSTKTSEWRDVTEKLDLLQARETKTDDVTQQIQNYTLFLQKLASQFDCLMQEDLILGRLVVYPEADRNEEDTSPTFENDVELIEELYSKRDDAEKEPEEAAQLDQEILDLGRKIILKYFTPSKREKPLHRLLEECAKRRFERKVLEEQLQKEAEFTPLQTTLESFSGNEDIEVPDDKETETRSEGEDSMVTVRCQTSGAKLKGNEEENSQNSRVKLRGNEEESSQNSRVKLRGNEEESFQTNRVKLRGNEEESFQTNRVKLRGNEEESSQNSQVKLRGNEEENSQNSRVKLRGNEEESSQINRTKLRGNQENSQNSRVKLRGNEENSENSRVKLRENEEESCQTSSAKLRGNEESCQTTQGEYTPKALMDMIDGLYEKRDGMLRGNEDTEVLSQQINELELRIIRRSSVKHKLRDLMQDYKSAQSKGNQSNAELRKLIKEMIVEEMEKEDTVKILYDKNVYLEESEESFFSSKKPSLNLNKLDTLKESSDLHVEKESHEHVLNWKLYLAHRNLLELNNNEERPRKTAEGCIPKKQVTTAKKKKKIKPEFRAQRTQSEREGAVRKLKESDFDKRFKLEECESLVKIDELIREDDPRPRKDDFFKGPGVLKTDAQQEKEESNRAGRVIEEEGDRRCRLIEENVGEKEESDGRWRLIEDVTEKEESGRRWRLIEEDIKEKGKSDRRWRLIEEESDKRWRVVEEDVKAEDLQLRITSYRDGRIEESDWIEKSRRSTEEIEGVIKESEMQIEDSKQIEDSGQLQVGDIEENQQQIEDSHDFGEENKLETEEIEEIRGVIEENQQQIEESEPQTKKTGALSVTVPRATVEEEDEQIIEDSQDLSEPQIEDIEESGIQETEAESVTTSRAAVLQFEVEEENEDSQDLSEENKLQIEEREILKAPVSRTTKLHIEEEENKRQIENTEESEPQIKDVETQSITNSQAKDTRSAFEEIELQFEELSEENRQQIEESEENELQIEETEVQNITMSQIEDTRSASEDIELQTEELSEENGPQIEDIEESETLNEETEVESASKLQAEDTWSANEESEEVIEEMKTVSGITEGTRSVTQESEDIFIDELEILSTDEENELQGVTELQFEEAQSVAEDNELQTRPQSVAKLRVEETRAVSEENIGTERKQLGGVLEERLQVEETQDIEEKQPRDTLSSVAMLRAEETRAVSEENEDTGRKQPRNVTEETRLAITKLWIEEARAVLEENEDADKKQPQGVTEETPSTVTKLRIEETGALSEKNKAKQPQGVTKEDVTIEETQANEDIEENLTELLIEETRAVLEVIDTSSVGTLRVEEARAVSEDIGNKQPQDVTEGSVLRPRDNEDIEELKQSQLQIGESRAAPENTDDKQPQSVIEESVIRPRDNEGTEEFKQPQLQIEETRAVFKDTNDKQPLGVTEESAISLRDNEDIEEKQPQLQIEETWAVFEDRDDKQPESAIEESVTRLRDIEEKQSQIEETWAVSEDAGKKQLTIAESPSVFEETVSPAQNKDAQGVTADEESVLSVIADEVSGPSCSTQPLGVIEENVITDMSCATQLQIEDNVLSECTDISDGGQDKSEEYHDFIDLDGIADIQNELLDNVFYDAQVKVEETTEINKQQSESKSETPMQLEGRKSGELKAPKTKKSFPSLSKLGKKAKKDSNCKIS